MRVACHLGRPMVNGVKGIGTDEPDLIAAQRPVDGGVEVYQLPRPAVLGVREGINLPRYPTMRGRLGSKKVELTVFEPDAPPGGQTLVRLHRPPETASETEILGTDASAAIAVVDLLEEIGLLA